MESDMTLQQLYATIRADFEQKPFLSRIHASVCVVKREKGLLAATLTAGAMTISSLAGATLSWLCMEGSVRSIMDVITDTRSIVRLRYLGDFAGWTSLAIFSVVAVKQIFERLMAEGEFLQAKELCMQELPHGAYETICELFGSLNARCLFSKTVVSRRLIALELYQEEEAPDPSLQLDRQLQAVFEEVQQNLENELKAKKYCHRYCLAQKAIRKKGCCQTSVLTIFGIVFPLILVLNFMLSLVGEVGLGKEVFGNREELTDIGHFGEWPINAIEAIATAYLFHIWYVISEGNKQAIKEAYRPALVNLDDDNVALKGRLYNLAKEELGEQAPHSAYLTLPGDEELDDITNRLEAL